MGEESICWCKESGKRKYRLLKILRHKVKETAAHMLKKLVREENTRENLYQLIILDGGWGKT